MKKYDCQMRLIFALLSKESSKGEGFVNRSIKKDENKMYLYMQLFLDLITHFWYSSGYLLSNQSTYGAQKKKPTKNEEMDGRKGRGEL